MTYTQASVVCKRNIFHLFRFTRPMKNYSSQSNVEHMNSYMTDATRNFILVALHWSTLLTSFKIWLYFVDRVCFKGKLDYVFMCTERMIPWSMLIDILDRYPRSIPSINPQSILNWHSIDTLVDTRMTLHRHLGRQSVESGLIFDRLIWVGRHSANHQRTVDQVSIECWPSINLDVDRVVIKMSIKGIDQEYRSTLDCGYL